jgi:methionine sulfoxide reductase catalytic subunit
MLIKKPSDIPSSEITDEGTYLRRREFIRLAAGAVAGAAAGSLVACADRVGASSDASEASASAAGAAEQTPLTAVRRMVTTNDPPNTFEQITTYNNYYEFGTGKGDPSRYAGKLTTKPWTVKIDGQCNKPGDYDLDDLIKTSELEDRIYRHRCVEAWSMVIPWVGIPLASVLKRAEPTSKATFVEFTTVLRPKEMVGLSEGGLRWPYTEGLRMDEAMHPLTILAVGLYGKTLLNQNGAPIRLVVPWKYGFKGAKSIVRIRFVEKMPLTSWVQENPDWYGFYSNVNPNVNPVRWDQSRERRLPSLFATMKTQIFNGYGDQVASMYAGLDLKRNY